MTEQAGILHASTSFYILHAAHTMPGRTTANLTITLMEQGRTGGLAGSEMEQMSNGSGCTKLVSQFSARSPGIRKDTHRKSSKCMWASEMAKSKMSKSWGFNERTYRDIQRKREWVLLVIMAKICPTNISSRGWELQGTIALWKYPIKILIENFVCLYFIRENTKGS